MDLFIFEGYRRNNKINNTESLIKEALSIYSNEKTAKIKKTKNGKPYFLNCDIEFSVSHTGQLWICAMCSNQVGVDIQELKNVNYEKLAKRFFSEEEEHYCELWGINGFFDVWVRKEAIVKYLGLTLGEGLSKYNTCAKGNLLENIEVNNNTVTLQGIEIGNEIKCVVATKEKEKICIKILN